MNRLTCLLLLGSTFGVSVAAVAEEPAAAPLEDAVVRGAFDRGLGEAGPALAEILGATLVTEGKRPGRDFTLAIEARADACYVVAHGYIGGGHAENELDWAWVAPTGAIQDFRIFPRGARVPLPGFCALRSGKVKATATVDVSGTANGLRYVVLRVDRAAISPSLAMQLVVDPGDWCDAERWASLFTRPIPGTIAYHERAPVLVLGRDPMGDVRVQHPSNPGYIRAVSIDSVSDDPPTDGVRVPEAQWKGCPNEQESPRAPLSKKLIACNEAVERRHTPSRIRSGNVTRVVYGDDYERDYDRNCGPLRKQGETAFRRAVDRIADAYVQSSPSNTIARVARMREALARPAPRGRSTKPAPTRPATPTAPAEGAYDPL